MCLAPITHIYAPLLLKADSSTFTVTKKIFGLLTGLCHFSATFYNNLYLTFKPQPAHSTLPQISSLGFSVPFCLFFCPGKKIRPITPLQRVIVAGVFPTEQVAKSDGKKKTFGLPYYRLKTLNVVKNGQNWPPIGFYLAETLVRGDLSQKSTYSNSI